MSRPDGFYWVRRNDGGETVVGELYHGRWLIAGCEVEYEQDEITVRSGRLTPPGERMSVDELAEALVFLARKHGYALGYELQDLERTQRSTPAR